MPVDLGPALAGHEVATVSSLGWEGVENSELLRRAAGRFDALLTMDQGLPSQHDVPALPLGVVLVRARSNRMVHLRPLVPAIQALEGLRPGELRRVGA